jgi:hypothetical protein
MSGKTSATSVPRSHDSARLAPGGTGAVSGAAAPHRHAAPGRATLRCRFRPPRIREPA